jgi:hypothetical protein
MQTKTTTQPTTAPKPDAQPVQAARHTPGPWHVTNGTPVPAQYYDIRDDCGDVLCRTNINTPRPISTANARLIASAPALLAALEKILEGDATGWRETWSLADVIQEHYRIARAALQLARGGAK